MALTSDTTKKISMYDICDEFGVSRSTPLKSFYRDGGIVPDSNSNVPTSGNPISIKDFYGAAAEYDITTTLSGSYNRLDLFGFLSSNTGWDGETPITGTITISGSCYSNVTTGAGLLINKNLIPDGSDVSVHISGNVRGRGGSGGNATNTSSVSTVTNGGSGGPGLGFIGSTNASLSMSNSGTISGGGGGGNARVYTMSIQGSIVRFAAAGGGGAGSLNGTGGTASTDADGSNGGLTTGGAGGDDRGIKAGDGGNRGSNGQTITGDGTASGAGSAGFSIIGFDTNDWPGNAGTLYGPIG